MTSETTPTDGRLGLDRNKVVVSPIIGAMFLGPRLALVRPDSLRRSGNECLSLFFTFSRDQLN